MNLWNTNQLVAQLKSGTLSQREQFKYFLVYSLCIAILMEIPYTPDGPYSTSNFMEAISSVLITALGTLFLYRVNAGGDNAEFLSRIISLSLPISIRLMVFGLPLAVIMYGIADWTGVFTDGIGLVITYGYCGFFYWRLYVHLHRVAHYALKVD